MDLNIKCNYQVMTVVFYTFVFISIVKIVYILLHIQVMNTTFNLFIL